MAKKTPTVSVIERRLQGPNVFHAPALPIPLADPQWTVRWENSRISPDHLWNVIHNLGWEYATPDDLACSPEEIGAMARDGRVVRGERGDEVLVKMRAKDYARIQQKKSEETTKQTFGKRQLKDAIVAGVAAEHGDRAASYLQQHVAGVQVADSRAPADEED